MISAIDAKVTHHMVDDWVYANANESADASQEEEEGCVARGRSSSRRAAAASLMAGDFYVTPPEY